jgi:hypothetical protein
MVSRVILCAITLFATIAFAQTKPTNDDGPWHKIKSADGHTKSKPVTIKFQPGTAKFRITFKSTADKDENDRPNPSASIRFGVLSETKRDVEDKPVNWQQVENVSYGKPGETLVRTYDVGLAKDGRGKWFQVVVTGYLSTYEVTIEDQSADDSARSSKSKSKSKKKKDDPDDADKDK